jgi:hypothetical protein
MKTNSAVTALRATMAGSLLATGIGILPAVAAEAGFRDMAPEVFAQSCTNETSFKQTCQDREL